MDKKSLGGFTLIELLVVMAVLGVLAVVVLVAINPGQRSAEARDTGRISSVNQLGRAIIGYYTANGGVYPSTNNWANNLVERGEVQTFPAGVEYELSGISACTTVPQPDDPNTYCYDEDELGGNGAIVFSVAESGKNRGKCTSPEQAYIVFSTVDGRGGIICSNGDPSAWPPGTVSYLD